MGGMGGEDVVVVVVVMSCRLHRGMHNSSPFSGSRTQHHKYVDSPVKRKAKGVTDARLSLLLLLLLLPLWIFVWVNGEGFKAPCGTSMFFFFKNKSPIPPPFFFVCTNDGLRSNSYSIFFLCVLSDGFWRMFPFFSLCVLSFK